jgi:hypothetical protein
VIAHKRCHVCGASEKAGARIVEFSACSDPVTARNEQLAVGKTVELLIKPEPLMVSGCAAVPDTAETGARPVMAGIRLLRTVTVKDSVWRSSRGRVRTL